MADGLKHRISGLDTTIDRMSRFPEKMQKRVATKAARKGANILRDAARKRARAIDDPSTNTSIAKNIVSQNASKLGRENGGVAMRVGVLGGARSYADTRANRRSGKAGQTYAVDGSSTNPGGDTWYWRLLEFGTEHMRPRPIFRPAMIESQQLVFSTIASEFSQQLNQLELDN